MVGERDEEVEVRELLWDEVNEAHVTEHGVSREDVGEVLANAPQFFHNLPSRSGTHVMIGPNNAGRFFYVVLAKTVRATHWRVITAYRYNRRRALRYYRSET